MSLMENVIEKLGLQSYRSIQRGRIDKYSHKVYGANRSAGNPPEIAREYKVRILGYDATRGSYDLVIGYLSEQYREAISSRWENIVKVDMGALDHLVTKFKGTTTKALAMYRLAWAGNDPFRLRFNLIFDANPIGTESGSFDLAKNYVMKPIRALQKMASPYEGQLTKKGIKTIAPPIEALQNPEVGAITVGIGIGYEFVGCVLTSVSPTYSNVFSDTGFPIHAECELEFQLIQPILKEDLNVTLED